MAATYSSLVGVAVGDKYEIRRVLGAGGMGVVCEAVHLDLGKRVAVKLIDKSMKESELIVARFRREARATSQIDSEHIVDVFDVGADPRVGLYMVMEYLTGEDLQGRLERDGHLEPKTVVMIAHQIARGLQRAHQAGVIHRDLKPANVFLTERDSGQMFVKLLDFGVSKLLDDGNARITGTGTPIGTPLYMSPEQAEGKDDVDGRADIWSLGAVMYEALSGAAPFPDRGSYHNTIVGILTSRPRLLHDAAPWVPASLARVVDAMLVHDPKARIQSAADVAQRLLDVFPTVLPDGTGKHTAVIVPQAAAALDTNADTELFTSASIREGARAAHVSVTPESGARSGPPSWRAHEAPVSGPPRPPDANRTRGEPSGALTGEASPVNGRLDPITFPSSGAAPPPGSSGEHFPPPPSSRRLAAASSSGDLPGSRGPKTAPLLPPPAPSSSSPGPRSFAHPSSSSDGVALMTPAVIEPLPTVDAAPTERDRTRRFERPAPRRRRGLRLVGVVLLLAAVGGGSYFVGKRGLPWRAKATVPAAHPPVTAAPETAAAPAPQPSIEPAPPPTTTATATAAASTAPSAGTAVAPVVTPGEPPAAASASAPRPFKKLRPRPKPDSLPDEIPSHTE